MFAANAPVAVGPELVPGCSQHRHVSNETYLVKASAMNWQVSPVTHVEA
jgi:hypothetical protein